MYRTLEILGSIVGAIGILICLLAGFNRLTGGHYLLGYETVTLFTGGIGLMVTGCLIILKSVAVRLRRQSG